MEYRSRFVVKAPLATVTEFHRRAASMGSITPPPIIVNVHAAPAILNDGDQMEFTMWLGPLPVRWVAGIEQLPNGFIDRQISGPFDQWVHRHTFEALSPRETVVHDRVEAAPKRHWFWWLVGMSMWLGMPILFGYRGWRSKAILEGPQEASQRLGEQPTGPVQQ
jgi:ligand-binding SRPBCC domain-containing protein